jgi:pimeloyl-ACP methyl ester carboxylesterase
MNANPAANIVLVHGSFVDGSGWRPVHDLLVQDGYHVAVVQNPTQSLQGDAAATRLIIDAQGGPVVLVGHSYGGAVITNAAAEAENVVGLVFVAAFAPDEGETLGDIEAGSKDSILNPALVQINYPAVNGGKAGVEFAIDPAKIHDAFAADLPEAQTALMAATQRPVADLAFGEPTQAPAWKHLPSWAVVASGDKAAGADVIRAEAERAGAKITEVEGSHVIMISQPETVTDVILEALASVGSETMAGTTA